LLLQGPIQLPTPLSVPATAAACVEEQPPGEGVASCAGW
jgi:hypothetical protein